MDTVIVERRFEAPAVLDELQAAEDAVAWCLRQHRVTFLRTYMSLDRTSMVCVYAAPDAESVRLVQQQAGNPVLRAWSADLLIDSGLHEAAPGQATVVVERELPAEMPRQAVIDMFAAGRSCFETHRARILRSFQSRDLRRVLCFFEAPDAESVRIANRQHRVPVTRAYSVTHHAAP